MKMHLPASIEFGNKLRSYRESQGKSVRGLARDSGVSFTLISALENAHRSAGPVTMEKLAAALKLSGRRLAEFIQLSAGTRGSKRLQTGTRRKGQEVLEVLLAAIVGVGPDEIKEVFFEPQRRGHHGYDILIQAKSGKVFGLDMTVQQKAWKIFVVPANDNGELPDSMAARTMPGTRVVTTQEIPPLDDAPPNVPGVTFGINTFSELLFPAEATPKITDQVDPMSILLSGQKGTPRVSKTGVRAGTKPVANP